MGTPNPCFYIDNVIQNGGFENGVASWSIINQAVPGTEPVVYNHPYNDGTHVLSVTVESLGTAHQDFNLDLGSTYRFRAYLLFESQAALDDPNWSIVITKIVGGAELYRLDRSTWADPQLESYFFENVVLAGPVSTVACRMTIRGADYVIDVISLGLVSNDGSTCEGAVQYDLETTPAELIFKAREKGPNPTPIRMKISGPREYYNDTYGSINYCQDWTITNISNTRITSDLMSGLGTDDCNDPVNMPVISYDTQGLVAGIYTDTITITGEIANTLVVNVTCYVLPGSETEFDPVDVPCVFAQG